MWFLSMLIVCGIKVRLLGWCGLMLVYQWAGLGHLHSTWPKAPAVILGLSPRSLC